MRGDIIYTVIAAVAITIGTAACCECIPKLDTDRKVDPQTAANVLFVHALPGVGKINAESDIKTVKGLEYRIPPFKYEKIGSGMNSIRYIEAEQNFTLFNMPLKLKKSRYYTFIGYGSESRANALVLNDSIPNYDPNKTYIRFVNVAYDSPEIDFHIFNNEIDNTITIPFEQFTHFTEVNPGEYSIEIKENKVTHLTDNKELQTGEINTILLRGCFNGGNDISIDMQFIDISFEEDPF